MVFCVLSCNIHLLNVCGVCKNCSLASTSIFSLVTAECNSTKAEQTVMFQNFLKTYEGDN